MAVFLFVLFFILNLPIKDYFYSVFNLCMFPSLNNKYICTLRRLVNKIFRIRTKRLLFFVFFLILTICIHVKHVKRVVDIFINFSNSYND